jgi:hypothetical protein
MCQHAKHQITFDNFSMTSVLIVHLFGVVVVNILYFFCKRDKVREV